MKNLAVLSILILAACGCDISKYMAGSENANSAEATQSPTPKVAPAESPTSKPTPAVPGLVAVLRKNVGKYPYEIKLLDNPELKSRLTKLMGKDFAALRKNWSVESPIEIESGIAKTTGCEAHNCGGNQYVLFVDLKTDDINVYHIQDEIGTKHYFEKNEIPLPKKFSDEITPEQ
jgi:hypothetical protein